MSRIEWSRRTADEVETVLGVMLCRANPLATRVRPSRGDRGVDVYVPDEDGRWTVYQVKSFTGQLTSSHKRQITKSWNSFLGLVAEKNLSIATWILMRPENPTWEDQEWLAGLTRDVTFPCRWQGLDHCEVLAADHQSVIDYYLFDGKERLKAVLHDLLSSVSGGGSEGERAEPGSLLPRLEAMHAAVNEHDPHFRYDFSVEHVLAGELPPIPSGSEGLVAAVTQAMGGRAVTFRVFARYREAVADRPVPGRFTLTAEPGSAEAVALRDFVEYGIPLVGASARELNIDLPGGLGATSEMGTVTLGPAQLDAAKALDLELSVLDETGEVELAVANILTEPATTGLDGRRFAFHGRERFGVFDILVKIDAPSEKMYLSITSRDFSGVAPADVLSGLYVLAAVRPPNQFQLKLRNGAPLDGPRPIPIALTGDAGRLIRICEALASIQRHSVLPIRVPDFTRVTVAEADDWVRAARLLNGDSLTATWHHVAVELHAGTELPAQAGDAFTVATKLPFVVDVGGVQVGLGSQLAQLAAARIDHEAASTPGVVHLVPAGDDSVTIQWGGPELPESLVE